MTAPAPVTTLGTLGGPALFGDGVFAPTFTISVAGTPLAPELLRRITDVTVALFRDGPSGFTLHAYDPDLTLVDPVTGLLVEGQRVAIGLGYVGGPVPELITGTVNAVGVSFTPSGAPQVTVEGYDDLHNLGRGTTRRVFAGPQAGTGIPDSEVARQLAADAGLAADVQNTGERRRPRVQNNESDLQLLTRMAAENGYALWVENGTLHFRADRSAGQVTLELGRDLVSFAPRLSLAGQVQAVEVRGWDPVQKQPFTGRAPRALADSGLSAQGRAAVARGSGGPSVRIVDDAPVTTAEEAQRYAEALFGALLQGLVAGTGSCAGRPDLRQATNVTIAGVLRFGGLFSVARVTHRLDGGGYRCDLDLAARPTAGPDTAGGGAVPAGRSAWTAPPGGVLPAIVTNASDPDGQGRVQVRIPGLDAAATWWARTATLFGGPSRGAWFLPEAGDEVFVAFEQGDAGRPVLLGGTWNGHDDPPESNPRIRTLVTPSGAQLRFDESAGTATVALTASDGETTMTLDGNGRSVIVHSAGDLTLEAPDGTVTVSGRDIQLQATESLSAEAGSNTSLSADSALSIRGATVDIN